MPFILPAYDSCHFCRCLSGESSWTVVEDDQLAVAIVNPRQYERGAILCIPRAHRETILDADDAEIDSLFRLAKRMARGAEIAFGAIGANVFQNNGSKGGQHVPHVHVHVVPRYSTSDADVVFLQRNFDVAPIDQQKQVAAAIQRALTNR